MGIMKRAFVLGAGGQVGRAAVRALERWDVTAVTRKDLDREDERALRQAAAGADVVVDVIPYTAEHAHQLLSLDVGAVIAISSASVYGLSGELPVPIREDHPRPGGGAYADGKVAMEDVLLGQTRIAATVLRPCAIHGPGSRSPREWYFLKRVLDGRTRAPVGFGGRSRPHTTATRTWPSSSGSPPSSAPTAPSTPATPTRRRSPRSRG